MALKHQLDLQRRSFLKGFRNPLQNENNLFFDDPVFWVDPKATDEDRVVWSFLVAGLTYGRVEQIKMGILNLERRLAPLGLRHGGSNLCEVLKNNQTMDLFKQIKGWRHRLNTDQDILQVFSVLQSILKSHDSFSFFIKNFFLTSPNFVEGCDKASRAFRAFGETQIFRSKKQKKWSGTGLSWFFPTPKDGGTCKRLMMWFRWLTRKDPWEIGVWAGKEWIQPKDLFVPLDTHILQWALKNALVKTKTANWKTVEKITAVFRELSPHDPLIYDYTLCHSGMAEFRSGIKKSQ